MHIWLTYLQPGALAITEAILVMWEDHGQTLHFLAVFRILSQGIVTAFSTASH